MPDTTSKKLAWFALIFSVLIISGSLTALCFGINTVAFMGVFMPFPLASLGFYSWKAKNENVSKIEQTAMYNNQNKKIDPYSMHLGESSDIDSFDIS